MAGSQRPIPEALPRRGFLAGAVVLGAAACSDGGDSSEAPEPTDEASRASTTAMPTPDLPGDPFTLGVSSGDPLPDSVLLWTRLKPAEGPVPDGPVPVAWQVAADEAFESVAAGGTFVTDAAMGNSVHADAGGLDPDTSYWYRFSVGDFESPIGRTRTAPASDANPESVRFGVASCQAWQSGFYAAHERMAAEDDIAALLFLGDYIYELESSTAARKHGMAPPQTLEEFRSFYELNNSDPDLRAALAAHPWIFTWDDHEVEDNYAADEQGLIGERAGGDPAAFPAKRAAAYQAWWEHVPVRSAAPVDGAIDLYRGFEFGGLVSLSVVDNRQYRTPIPEGDGAGPRPLGGGPQPPEAFSSDGTYLGLEQEEWLHGRLAESDATWNVLAQQSITSQMNRRPDLAEGGFSLDSWDGYVAARQRLMDVVAGDDGEPVENFVSLGGDIHTSAVADLHADPTDLSSAVVGTEFIGPSISARELLQPVALEGARSIPNVKLYDIDNRGYMVVEFTQRSATASYRWLDDPLDADSAVLTDEVWLTRSGEPGAVRGGG
ncbi:MAG: alkaline phosphatase D family protein [Microthrixaceae bacterium]